ncbi:MAG TPA: substrate-binding domain-containing protein [Thermodesulfobacteriota bacterium]|nr:substrate-binding domain-containing protein [Thermodesulfobacteriota bacterium]
MRWVRTPIGFLLLMLFIGPSSLVAATLRLATGSPYELGLVDALFTEFKKEVPCELKVTKAGSGDSLRLLKTGKVDLIIVHAPEAEQQVVKEGWALNRTYLGGNDFVILGPREDPAGIKECKNVLCAYKKIADKKAVFVTRGDNSGTHKKELTIWEKAGIKPEGSWYRTSKDFMMAALQKAASENGYFMVDRSTYIVARKKNPNFNLAFLFEGDPMLINQYHVLTINPTRYPQANYALAKKFVEFLKGDSGQKIIGSFGKEKFGESLYFSALQKSEK